MLFGLLTARGKIIMKWDYLFLKHLHMFDEFLAVEATA